MVHSVCDLLIHHKYTRAHYQVRGIALLLKPGVETNNQNTSHATFTQD